MTAIRRDKPDGNAKELLSNLRLIGWVCRRIRSADQTEGIPDSIVARRQGRKTHLLEIKRLGNKLSAGQVSFYREWPGCVHVATNSFEANLLLEECEKTK